MESKSIDVVVSALKQLVKYCQEMHELLKNDINHFGKKDLVAINESNYKKTEIINSLTLIINDLAGKNPVNFIDAFIEKLDSTTQLEIKSLLNHLKTEITDCYRYIMTNSHFVFSNMQHIKETCDRLLSAKLEMECIYDQTGNKVK